MRQSRFSDISIDNHLITLPTKIGASVLPSSVAPAGSASMHNRIVPGGGMVAV